MAVAETPKTSGKGIEVGQQVLGERAGDVDRRHRGVAAAEDPVLHVLHVQPVPAQPVQHVCEHADPVEVAHRQRGRADPARSEVDAVRCLALDEGVDDLDDPGGDGVLRLLGRRTDVVGADHLWVLCEMRGPLGRAGPGLVGEDVEAGSQTLGLERLEQRGLVDQLTARRVEEDGPVLHPFEERPVDQAGRGGARRQMEGDDVGGREQLVERARPARSGGRRSARRRQRSRSGLSSATRSIPKARARWATSRPIEPRPRMPIVEPSRPRALL